MVNAVAFTNEIVDREDVARVVALSTKDDMRPAVHAGGYVPVLADASWTLGDRVEEDTLICGARKRVDVEEIVPGAETPDTLVRRRAIVELKERRYATSS